MRIVFVFCFCFLFAGCLNRPGWLRLNNGTKIEAPKDALAPSTINENDAHESLTIPAGSRITVTDTLATPEKPGSKVTDLVLSKDTVRTVNTATTVASVSAPRPPDKDVELRKVDNAERRPLLYIAIALGLATGALVYFRLLSLAKLTGLGAAVALGFWWALGNEVLLRWLFIGLAVLTAGYFIYSDWRKRTLKGTIATTEQSVKEFTVDNPALGKSLQEEYLDVNRDESHKAEAAKAIIDTSYIDQRTREKLAVAPL